MVQTDQDMSRYEDQTPNMPTPTPLLPYIWAVIPLCMAFLSRGHARISWVCLLHCSFLRAQLVSVWPFCLSVPRRCMFSRHLLSGKKKCWDLGGMDLVCSLFQVPCSYPKAARSGPHQDKQDQGTAWYTRPLSWLLPGEQLKSLPTISSDIFSYITFSPTQLCDQSCLD